MIEKQNIWHLAAAWWLLTATFGAALTIPVIGWDEVWAAYRYLIAQVPCIFVIGFILKTPARYVARMLLIGVLFMLPAALSCLAPALIIAFILDPQPAPARAFFIVVHLCGLLVWRVVRISGLEDEWSREPIASHIFTRGGAACFVGPSSIEGREHNLLGYISWLALLYPALILLVWIFYFEAEPVYILAALPLAWIGIGIIAWSANNFVHWILRIKRHERENGIPVYIEPPAAVQKPPRRRSNSRAKK